MPQFAMLLELLLAGWYRQPVFCHFWNRKQRHVIVRLYRRDGGPIHEKAIWPMNPERILKRFEDKTLSEAASGSSARKDTDWRQIDRLVRSAVKDTRADEAKELSQTVHHLHVQNELLHHENDGLKEALTAHKKHKGKGKTMDLQQRKEFRSSAVMWTPRKFREARTRKDIKQQEAKQLELKKADTKKMKAAATLYNKKIAEEKRVAREEAKVVREKEPHEHPHPRTSVRNDRVVLQLARRHQKLQQLPHPRSTPAAAPSPSHQNMYKLLIRPSAIQPPKILAIIAIVRVVTALCLWW
jgi:hypothetical protein